MLAFLVIVLSAGTASAIERTEMQANLLLFSDGPRHGFSNLKGETVLEPQFDDVVGFGFHNGIAIVGKDGKCGLLRDDGTMIVPAENEAAVEFRDGLAGLMKGGRWGFVNSSGKWVVEPKFLDAQSFVDGLAAVRVENSWGYIDTKGRLVIPPAFEEAYQFSEGLALVKRGGKYGFIDSSGRWKFAMPAPYGANWGPPKFLAGVLPISIEGKIGFIDTNGEVRISPQYEDVWRPVKEEPFFPVKKAGRWGYIDPKGKVVVPIIFDGASPFREGLASVNVGGKSGYIDLSGKWVIAPEYAQAQMFSEGLAMVQKESQGPCGFIDQSGKLKIPLKLDCGGHLFGQFATGLARVHVQHKTGYINHSGEFVRPPSRYTILGNCYRTNPVGWQWYRK